MSARKRVLIVFGTRPEAIKLAPVVRRLRDEAGMEPIVAVTAQHREMLDQVLNVFDIVPDFDLDIQHNGQSLAQITTRALDGLMPAMMAAAPDLVLVQGDTTTTLAGALAAFYEHVPVVHLEAGLRTGDVASPFPEEINRRLTTQLSTLHLAPTADCRTNLLNENVKPDDIAVTGNTVIDALLWSVDRCPAFSDVRLEGVDGDRHPLILVTAHRREAWGAGMMAIGAAIREIARLEPFATIAFPIHKNPLVREAILPQIEGLKNVIVTEPLPYGEFTRLLSLSSMVLTDSGGIQEEAPSLGKPVLVMRDTTERPEAIVAGTARLVGTETWSIVDAVEDLLHDPRHYSRMAHAVNPYGDGCAAPRAVAAMKHMLDMGERADEFVPLEAMAWAEASGY